MRRAKLDIALHNMSTDAVAVALRAGWIGGRTIDEVFA
jgi:hypothetical protein